MIENKTQDPQPPKGSRPHVQKSATELELIIFIKVTRLLKRRITTAL